MVRRKENGRRNARTLKSTQEMWKEYKRLIPEGASEIQFRETKKAFYAGLTEMFAAMEAAAYSNTASEYLHQLDMEIGKFWEEVNERYKLSKE